MFKFNLTFGTEKLKRGTFAFVLGVSSSLSPILLTMSWLCEKTIKAVNRHSAKLPSNKGIMDFAPRKDWVDAVAVDCIPLNY